MTKEKITRYQAMEDDMIEYPLQIVNFKPLTREEAHERSKSC